MTGTSVSKRKQFRKMIRDCEAGKIDLIVTKSISRFARNTLECLTFVRHLNEIGVHLIFESNHIDTRTAFSEMLLTVLAAFAQEESRSISLNTTWSIRKRYNNIMYILQNETYMGDKLLQKQPPKNFLTKKPDERVPYESNYLENDHEAIVDRKTWDTVQEIIRQKRAVTAAVGRIGGRPHFLYGKLFCGECGEPMTRRTLNGPTGIKHKIWTCRGRHEGRKGNGCKLRNVKEGMLLQAIEDSIGGEIKAENAEKIKRVIITEDDIAVETS